MTGVDGAGNGNSVTFTIPLEISISVGGGQPVIVNNNGGSSYETVPAQPTPRYERRWDTSRYDQWRHLSGQRVRVTTNQGRTFVTSADDFNAPNGEFPLGRMIAYSYVFGSGGNNCWGLNELEHVEAIPEPTEREKRSYKKYVGKRVRLHFDDSYNEERYGGDQVYVVKSLSDERNFHSHPHGGLEVDAEGDLNFRSGVIPFDLLSNVEIVDAKVDAKQSKDSAPIRKRRRPQQRKKPV